MSEQGKDSIFFLSAKKIFSQNHVFVIVSIHLKTSEVHFAAGYAVIHVLSLNPLKTPSSLVPNACVSPTYPFVSLLLIP